MLDKNENIFNVSSNAEKDDKISDIRRNINEIGRSLEQVFECLQPKIKFDDFLNITGEYIDEIIIETCKNAPLSFVAGTCELSISDEKKHLEIKASLYYKNTSDQWVQKIVNGKISISRFDEETQRTTLRKIYKEGMKIDIESPMS